MVKLDEGVIASCSITGRISVWDYYRKEHPFALNFGIPAYVIIKLRDNIVAAGFADNTIKVLDIQGKIPQLILSGHQGPVTSLCSLKNGGIASSSTDKTIRIWNTDTCQCQGSIDMYRAIGPSKSINSLVEMDNFSLLGACEDGSVIEWNKRYNHIGCLKNFTSPVTKVIMLGTKYMLTSTDKGSITLTEINSMRDLKTFTIQGGAVRDIALLGEKGFVAVSNDMGIYIFK